MADRAFSSKAFELTNNNPSNALLVAAGSSLDLRATTIDVNGTPRNACNVLTRDSLGIDSLHHFAFAAFNTYDNQYIHAALIYKFANSREVGPPYSRADGTDADLVANTAGAKYGQSVLWHANPLSPSATIPLGREELRRLETQPKHNVQ